MNKIACGPHWVGLGYSGAWVCKQLWLEEAIDFEYPMGQTCDITFLDFAVNGEASLDSATNDCRFRINS